MKGSVVVVVVVLCLAVGFGAGYMVRGPGAPVVPGGTEGAEGTEGAAGGETPSASVLEDARAAVRELAEYHGDGPRASVKVRRMVDRIVRGGEAVLPDVERALETCGLHKYNIPAYSLDVRSVDLDLPPTRRTAFMVALDRIGGDEAVRLLLAATKPTEVWIENVTAYLFLARRAEREDVQAAFVRAARELLATRMNGPQVHRLLEIFCGRLPVSLAPQCMNAFREGWAFPDTMDRVAEILFTMDEARAGEFFESLLGDTDAPLGVRAQAARALARMPDRRPLATAMILKDPKREIVQDFTLGLEGRGRFGSVGEYQDIREYGTPETIRKFNETNVADFESAIAALEELDRRLDPDHPVRAAVTQALGKFRGALASARSAMEQIQRPR